MVILNQQRKLNIVIFVFASESVNSSLALHETMPKEETVKIKQESDDETSCVKGKTTSSENSLNLLALVANSHLIRKTKKSKFGAAGNQV